MDYNNWGTILAAKRKEKGLSQPQLADLLTVRGFPTRPTSISKWEKQVNVPSIIQFLVLCDILDIQDVNATFGVAVDDNPYYRLNQAGKEKVKEYTDLLVKSGMFVRETPVYQIPRRNLRIYDIAVSAGTGQFLDSDKYSTIDVGEEVPSNADFGVRISGDSMEPQYLDHQLVWVHQQNQLDDGNIGIFYLNGNAFIKKFHISPDGISLISLNPTYEPIQVSENSDFMIYGQVVC